MKAIALLLPGVLLVSCAGYRLGGSKPAGMAGVETVAVRMFANDTQHPRAEVIATSAVATAISQDGTYRMVPEGQADAVLEGRIKSIHYTAIRSRRLDTLRPEELAGEVTLEWTLTRSGEPPALLGTGEVLGTSTFFVDRDLQTARNNALPDAMERAAEAMVARMANGF